MKGAKKLMILAAMLMFVAAPACGGSGGGGGGDDVPVTGDAGPEKDAVEPEEDGATPDDAIAPEDTAPEAAPEVDDKPPIPSDCGEAAALFEACGGDVVGVWNLVEMCFGEEPGVDNPMIDMCPESTMDADFNVAGTFTFDETTLTAEFTEMAVNVTLTMPQTCFEGSPLTCEGLDAEEDLTCAAEGENCICTAVHGELTDEPEVSDYVVEGNELVVTDSEGVVDHVPYCVSGTQAIVKIVEVDEETGTTQTNYMLIEKQ